MNQPANLLDSHPAEAGIESSTLQACIEACFAAMRACTTCADACLAEESRAELVRCIRVNLDCADVCDTTGRLLSRLTQPDWILVRAQIQACVVATRACAEECAHHAGRYQHCRACLDACRACEVACTAVLAAALVSPPEVKPDVDDLSAQSFPASDPPSTVGAISPGRSG